MNDDAEVRDAPTSPAGSGAMFDEIAGRYDLLNRIMSMGIDQSWRDQAVDALEVTPESRVLDVATGTADLAIRIARRAPGARVFGLDPSAKMLAIGQQKIAGLPIELTLGSAEELPFEDASFDGVCIAFGIRNVPDRPRALAEMARVCRGRVVILELSEPRTGILAPLARFHVHNVVPWLGSMLSGSREYRYLQRSISAFPPPEDFASTMEQAGLSVLEVRPLTLGVCCLYVAQPRRS